MASRSSHILILCRHIDTILRIKPNKRLVHENPEALSVPEGINQVWSMDFIHDQLQDGRSIRLKW
jgi:putative transposase